MKRFSLAMMALVCFVSISCSAKPPAAGIKADGANKTKGSGMTEQKQFAEPKAPTVDATKKYTAVIKTSKGDIVVELYAKEAPLSVTNFRQLADGGFYDGLVFHRVVPDFVIQGGDPTGTGRGGPGYTIPAEIGMKHKKGALAWARLGDEVNPERRSSGSQFYVALEPLPSLDGKYTVFGQTISGEDVAEGIRQGDVIESVTVREE